MCLFITTGFTTADAPWLPVNPSYREVNVASQLSAEPRSHLKNFMALSAMRHHQSVLFGETGFKTFPEDNVFAFSRVRKGNPGYLVVANLSPEEVTVDLSDMDYLSVTGTVHLRSAHPAKEGDGIQDGQEGDSEDEG